MWGRVWGKICLCSKNRIDIKALFCRFDSSPATTLPFKKLEPPRQGTAPAQTSVRRPRSGRMPGPESEQSGDGGAAANPALSTTLPRDNSSDIAKAQRPHEPACGDREAGEPVVANHDVRFSRPITFGFPVGRYRYLSLGRRGHRRARCRTSHSIRVT